MTLKEVQDSGLSPENVHPRGFEQFDPASGAERVRTEHEVKQITIFISASQLIIGRAPIGTPRASALWQLQRVTTTVDGEEIIDWAEDATTGLPTRKYCFVLDDFDMVFDALPVASGSLGSTKTFVATAVNAVALVPAVSTEGEITGAIIRCANDQPNNRRLHVSVDGGSGFHVLSPGEFIAWIPKGGIKQISVKTVGSPTDADYEITLNRIP